MKKIKNIPTLKEEDDFKIIMSYYDSKEYGKKNINDFYVHGLSDDTYELRMPLPPHRQTNHSIILITQGSIVASSGIDNYTVEQNAMILIPAGQVTSLSFMSDDIEGYYLHFSDDYLSHTKVDLSKWLIRPVIKFANAELEHLTILLKRMQKLNENEANADIIKLYLATFLAEMEQSSDFRLRINFPAYERLTMKFKRLLNYNITKDRSVSFYASELNVTPNHLNKSVKLSLGRSASVLVDEMLILEAKVLLQKNNMSISEIAFEIGLEVVSYFGRFFKKHTGFAPTEYRKMIELSE